MMHDYGLDHGELGEHFLVLTVKARHTDNKRVRNKGSWR